MRAMLIRQLGPADAAAFQALRLAGLREHPEAFASSWHEEQGEPLDAVAARLAPHGVFGVYGAFDDESALVGVAGLGHEALAKMAHKAVLWGMVVASGQRRRGVARQLVAEVLARATAEPQLRQVTLGVHAANHAARALYESLGFVAWGTEPAAAWVDGRAQDETWMVCLLPGRD